MRIGRKTSVVGSPIIAQLGSAISPTFPGYTTSSTRFQNVCVQGNYAYLAASGGTAGATAATTLTIYDVTDPTNPIYKSQIITFASAWSSGAPYFMNASYSMVVSNNFVYVASAGGTKLYIVNVADPANPYNYSAAQLGGSPGASYSVDVYGNYALLATQNKGLTVVDCTNPLAPSQVFQEGGTTNKSVGVAVSGKYCFTTNYQTTAPWTVRYFKTWDMTNPASPSLVNTYTLPAGTKPGFLTIYGNYAYVTDLNTSSVQILDITNPLAPNYLASMQASASFNVINSARIYGNYAYLTSGQNATYGGAIDVYDITNKSAPVLITTYQQGIANDVFGACYLYNNILYVADYGTGASPNTYLRTFSTLTKFSDAIPFSNMTRVSAQGILSGSSPTGTYTLQGSDDPYDNPVNFSDIPGTSKQVSGSGIYLIPKTSCSYQYVRASFTGIGSSNITLKSEQY